MADIDRTGDTFSTLEIMKTKVCLIWTSLLAVGLTLAHARTDQVGLVAGDRVNVRAQPTIFSEVVTQLGKGEPVVLLEEIALSEPRAGDEARWFRIRLPKGATAWVHADFVDADQQAVRATRLNLRAGPGENFSILGRLEQGAAVRVIRPVDEWLEIEPPEHAYAFIAARLVAIDAPVKPLPPETLPKAVVEPELPLKPEEIVEPPLVYDEPIITEEPVPAIPELLPAFPDEPPMVAPVAPIPEPRVDPPSRRVVKRDGVVRRSLSPRAPSPFVLEDEETGRLMNYLIIEIPDVPLRNFSGHKVTVTGEEAVDRRWPRTPVLKIETIQLH
jgi:SH3-like domain-containing protein